MPRYACLPLLRPTVPLLCCAEMMSLVFPEQSRSPNKYTMPGYLEGVNQYLHYLKTASLDDFKVRGKLPRFLAGVPGNGGGVSLGTHA
jgi:hypothetical protein